MSKVQIKAYPAPMMVLLAFDWPDGHGQQDFLGFAIKRTPDANGNEAGFYLPNRVGFNGPNSADAVIASATHAPMSGKRNTPTQSIDKPSDQCPIQKFYWWDAQFSTTKPIGQVTYTVTPVMGTPTAHKLLTEAASEIKVEIPNNIQNGSGTYFNRAVVSSQAFSREFPSISASDKDEIKKAQQWLAAGLENVVPDFLKRADGEVDGAIYHLTDTNWIIPALNDFTKPCSLIYDSHHSTGKSSPNDGAIKTLEDKRNIHFYPRQKTNIMHDKFLVRLQNGLPQEVLTGSANFTPEGLSSQANLIHLLQSPQLARLFLERQKLLRTDPTVATTANGAEWSQPVGVGKAQIRVYFSPEKQPGRDSIDTIIDAVKKAQSSVLFCCFDPTDHDLIQACFEAGNAGKMMFGLVNTVGEPKNPDKTDSQTVAKVDLYHRSESDHDVVGHETFRKDAGPQGFWFERNTILSQKIGGGAKSGSAPEVYVHHKFVVIDAETDDPIIYCGSANLSANSTWHNDENILEIRKSPETAAIYLAEFMRLFDHYRSRAAFDRWNNGHQDTFKLTPDSSWAKQAYTPGTLQYRARLNLVGTPTSVSFAARHQQRDKELAGRTR
jgi:phosphatidylserine/phosphatidylglycerophosphate/cardiolipin synthase-like enzyme